MKMIERNNKRAEAGARTVDRYGYANEETEEAIVDAIADLLHYAAVCSRVTDIKRVHRMAMSHVLYELDPDNANEEV